MIRLANLGDIDRITEIYEHIHDAEEAGNAVIGWNRHIYPTYQTALEGINKKDMFVEEVDNTIIASGRINHLQLKEYSDCKWQYNVTEDEIMVLHTLTVDPENSGKGYGSEFVKFYEEYSLANNCHYLRIDTQEKNVLARAFYKRLGFREAGVVPCVFFDGIKDVQLVCLEKRI